MVWIGTLPFARLDVREESLYAFLARDVLPLLFGREFRLEERFPLSVEKSVELGQKIARTFHGRTLSQKFAPASHATL